MHELTKITKPEPHENTGQITIPMGLNAQNHQHHIGIEFETKTWRTEGRGGHNELQHKRLNQIGIESHKALNTDIPIIGKTQNISKHKY